MIESKSRLKPSRYSPEAYLQHVEAFLHEAGGWCERRGLAVERGVVTLREQGIAEYQAPSLGISKDGKSLAKILSAGSRFIGAQGGIDLVGNASRDTLLLCLGKGPALSKPTARMSWLPLFSRVKEDGWYWIDSQVWEAKLVDESLFLKLFTYVSFYEF
ncbi:hypothetical protein [Trinickia dinghuensis]|uniref:Uncharacterized protein n=1 Tax=Trinickia dinghuensis TaxID=2291023 RepID=A0A3D8JTT2_9BURK|nr:hypothetical protein [Trinickia dinghuensis]RDU96513.1 hypothetical protein DWV00_23260 [Trinickia dinghuensis]